jgi:hypothetical protein
MLIGRRSVHHAAWAFFGVVVVLVLLIGALGLTAPPPAPLAEVPVRPAPAPAPALAGAAADLRAARAQVQAETAASALRDQADQARTELADLQSQQAAAHAQVQAETAALAALRDQAERSRMELADLQSQQAAARATLADLERRQAAARAEAAGQARRQAAREQPHAKAPLILSPPPTILGQIPAGAVDGDTATASVAGPRVFVQYRTGSSGQQLASDLTRRLLTSDFSYAEMRPVPVSTQIPLIRYFHAEDAGAARKLADLLRGDGGDFRVQYARGASAGGSDGLLEVWIP